MAKQKQPRRKESSPAPVSPLPQQAQDGVMGFMKKYESEISSFFGIVVALALAGLLLFFIRKSLPAPQISDSAQNADTQEQAANANEYVVKAGDGLWQIAQEVYGDGYQWKKIAEANNLTSPYTIAEGQKLTIPEKEVAQAPVESTTPSVAATPSATPVATATAAPTPVATPVVTPTPQATAVPVATTAPVPAAPAPTQTATSIQPGSTYTVTKGDHLWKIAVAAYGDGYKWTKIFEANRDKIKQPGYIEIGWQLTIPTL